MVDVFPMRQQNRGEAWEYWGKRVEPRQGMWGALDRLARYIVDGAGR